MEITPATATPETISAPTPVAAAPVSPVVEAVPVPVTVTPAPVETIVAPVAEVKIEAAPVIEAPKVAEPEVKKESTVLGTEKVAEKPTEKPTEIKPTTEGEKPEEKKAESSQSDEPAPLPTYDAFVLPEGVTLNDERIGDFTKTLGEFETLTKADHGEVQKLAQTLVGKHVAEVQETVKRVHEAYTQTWEKQKNDWKESFINDPEIGGNRQETTVNAALDFIRTHGGNENQQKEFRVLMDETGLGNHPALIRLLASANTARAEGKPLPAPKPISQPLSKVAKRYGNKN